MSSLLQSEASRINGAKSRGPKTPAGKANSSRNALTHGVFSGTIVMAGENASRFAALLASLRAELKPRTCIEDGLVEDLAGYRWRQRRLLSMETAGFTHAVLRQDPQSAAESGPTRAVLAMNDLTAGSRTLELINRYERGFNRMYNRTLHSLYTLRTLRARDEKAAPGIIRVEENLQDDSNPGSY